METQPRGKKRSTEEHGLQNIDTGGKKSKKMGKPKLTSVCAIYRRDIASFLPREKIQQWRLTSRRSNSSLIEFPSELPPFKYSRLMVIFFNGLIQTSADRCRVKGDGFLNHKSGYLMEGTEFNSIFKFRFCCRDVKDRASKLDGQRLFPDKPNNEGVAFRLDWNGGKKKVVCRVPNLLTKKTAPAMLHFLHHLSQACYEHIEIVPGVTAYAEECALSPLVLQALPKFRLRGVKFIENGGQLISQTVKMASEMHIRYNVLSHYSPRRNFGTEILQLLDFIANGSRLVKKLEMHGRINCQDVDQIIKYFEEDVHSLEGVIQHVRYSNNQCFGNENWPARCPRARATQVMQKGDRQVEYRFDYANVHSKAPFSLLLEARSNNNGTLICQLKLAFGMK